MFIYYFDNHYIILLKLEKSEMHKNNLKNSKVCSLLNTFKFYVNKIILNTTIKKKLRSYFVEKC